jgi:hypothetical protein
LEQSEVSPLKPKATIKSLAKEVDLMIMEWLSPKDALNVAKALKLAVKVSDHMNSTKQYQLKINSYSHCDSS